MVSFLSPCPSLLVWDVAWNVHTVVFPHFYFLFVFVPLMLLLSVLFLVAVISLPPCFFMKSSSHWMDVLTYVECGRVLLLVFFKLIRRLSDIRPYTSSWVFLFSGLFVEVLLMFILRIVPRILRGGTPQMFIPLMRFLVCSFLVLLSYSFLTFSFISACLIVSASDIPYHF